MREEPQFPESKKKEFTNSQVCVVDRAPSTMFPICGIAGVHLTLCLSAWCVWHLEQCERNHSFRRAKKGGRKFTDSQLCVVDGAPCTGGMFVCEAWSVPKSKKKEQKKI